MRKSQRTRRSIMPRWFRFLLGGSFALFVLVALLVRGGGEAVARALLASVASPASPLLNASAGMFDHRGMPPSGRYRLNGMSVKYDTFAPPQGAGPALIDFEKALAKTGFHHRIIDVQGLPTTVGIHPDTRVMLSARPGRDVAGMEVLRITQMNLAELDAGFRAEIPGIPEYPGASGKTLIESTEGDARTSLTYFTGGLPEDIRDHYVRYMRPAGWSATEAPGGAGAGATVVLFERVDEECSLTLVEMPDSSGTFVMVTLGERSRQDA